MPRLFGTDGVRGVVNQELTPELALRVGNAVGARLAEQGPARPVLMGCDSRRSADMLQGALTAGLTAAGRDTIMLGVIPTPGLAWLVRDQGAAAGIMVSASHNPPEYNGIKIFAGDGHKLDDDTEDLIEKKIREPELFHVRATAVGVSRLEPDLVEAYLEFLHRSGPSPLDGMKLVVDCANGAVHRLAPELFRRLGAEVTVLCAAPDGLNINQACGSTHPERAATAVRQVGADAGFTFDGDGDRCIAVDAGGRVIDGDVLLAITALARHRQGNLRGQGVVGTVMSNLGLELALRERGLTLQRAPVGDRHVLAAMYEHGYVIGGEPSGHLVFLDAQQTTGDGLLTALQVLNVMHETGQSLGELAGVMTPVPQRLVNLTLSHAADVLARPEVQEEIALERERLQGHGRIIVRPSGTEPLVRVMVEARSEASIEESLTRITEVLRRYGARAEN